MEKTKRAQQIEEELGKKELKPWLYATFTMAGTDQVIGELTEGDRSNVAFEELLDGKPVKVMNPKRFIRVQQMAPGGGGLSIMTLLGDWDLLSSKDSHIWIRPTGGFMWADQDPKSYENLLENLAEYVQRQMLNRAAEAGLTLGGVRPT